MNVLVVCPTGSATGNFSTASRIAGHVAACGQNTHLVSLEEALALLSGESGVMYQLIIVLHALRSANLCGQIPSHCKLIVVFGGTDLNEASKDEDKLSAMKIMVARSSKSVAFSPHLMAKANHLWPEMKERIITIHQSCTTQPSSGFQLAHYLQQELDFCVGSRLIALLVAGIRPVKDPLFLCNAFADNALGHRAVLVIVGPILDEHFGSLFLQTIGLMPNVVYAGSLTSGDTHASIQQSFCLVNSSLSEGMSAAILEAFSLGTAVLARENPGNSYLVTDDSNGFLYSSDMEFTDKLKLLINDSERRQLMVSRAKEFVESTFNYDTERKSYTELINSVMMS